MASQTKTTVQKFVEQTINEHQLSNKEDLKKLVEYADLCSIAEFEKADKIASNFQGESKASMLTFRTKFNEWRFSFE